MKFEKDLIEDLKKLGLKELESRVYITLLRLKQASVSQIAKETQVHRRSVYDNLNILIRKGLISELIKNKIKYFECLPPENLKIILEEQEKVLNENLPYLKSFYDYDNDDVKVQIHYGDNSLKFLLEEISKEDGQKYWLGGGGLILRRYTESISLFIKKFLKTDVLLLQPLTPRISRLSLIVPKKNFRVLPNHFVNDQGILITQTRVLIGIISDQQSTIISIKSINSAKAFKSYFDVLWNMSKELDPNKREKLEEEIF